MIITVIELQEWSDYPTIQEMSEKKLADAILIAETKLGVYLCDVSYDQFKDEDGVIVAPPIIELMLKRLAEVYAFDMSEDSKAITGFLSETMGNYSYSKGNVGSIISAVFASMADLITPYSKCDTSPRVGQTFRMRRV